MGVRWGILARCAAMLVPVAVAVGFLYRHLMQSATAYNYAAASAGIRLAALQHIRAATQSEPPAPWYHQIAGPSDVYNALLHTLLAFFGLRYVNPLCMSLDWSFLTVGSEREAGFCHDLLGYMWVNPNVSGGISYPSVYADRADVKEWIRACKKVYHELGGEEKALLEPLRLAGHVPVSILIPEPDDHGTIKAAARAKAEELAYEDSKALSREEILELCRESLRHSSWGRFVEEPPGPVVDFLARLNLRAPPEVPSTWAAVGEALRAGRITRFDARPLVSKELLNVSFQQMKSWEGDEASRIPVFGDFFLPTSFEAFAGAKGTFLHESTYRSHITINDEDMIAVGGRGSTLDPNVRQRIHSPPYSYGFSPAGYVHTRRLREFHKKLPEVERLMGIDGDVLRGQSMLWMGAVQGGFHYDEEANVYVQLTGETFAFLVPQNFTDAYTGALRHPWNSAGLPGWSELAKDPYLKDVPIYLVHLRAGDGITLQGRTYHRFMAQTYDRIALNWFFIPGWRRMEYNPSDWYAQEAERSLTRLALRQLWARTLARLYEDTGRGVIYMGTKLEYL